MSRLLSTAAVVLVLVALLAVGGCSTSTSSPTPTSTSTTPPSTSAGPSSFAAAVSIVNRAFAPTNVTVKVGQTVQWTNNDSVTHTVTGQEFDSGDIAPGATYSHTFTAPGTYPYKCTIHPGMAAQVTVIG